MPRIPRSFLPDGIYHVCTRGVDRCDIYRDEDDYRFFGCLFRKVVERCGWTVHAFCL